MSSDARKTPKHDDAAGPADLATLWARHGNKVLILITAALLVFWAVKYRRNQAMQRQEQTRSSLASAWLSYQELSQAAQRPASPDMLRQQTAMQASVNQSVQAVLDDQDVTPTQAAWAWMARGEMYWALAHRPADPAAATQAATAPASQPAADNLKLAKDAYTTIVTQYASADPTAATISRYALAAIAEETGDLAEARKQYRTLIETPNYTDGTKSTDPEQPTPTMAEARLKLLDDLEKPTLLLPATQPTVTLPPIDFNSLPGLSGPATPPSSSGARPTPPPADMPQMHLGTGGTTPGPTASSPATAPSSQPAR